MGRVLVVAACLLAVGPLAVAQPSEAQLTHMISRLAAEGLITQDEGFQALQPETLPVLIGAMQHPDSEARILATIGLASAGATERLEVALRDEDPGVRAAAAYGLGAIGPPAVAAAPSLIQALGDADGSVRNAASRALGAMGPAAAEPLQSALAFPDGETRRAAVRALARMRCSGPALAGVLLDPDKKVARAAENALKRMGRCAAPALGEQLSDPRYEARLHAALGLHLLGENAEPACVALARALGDAAPDVRQLAQRSLTTLGEKAADAVPALAEQLLHGPPEARVLASAVLARVGRRSAPFSIHLVWALADPQPDVRANAALALFELGKAEIPAPLGRDYVWSYVTMLHRALSCGRMWRLPKIPKTTDDLLSELEDGDYDTRLEAVWGLELVGRDATQDLEDVALNHRDWRVRERAVLALGRLGPRSVRPLARALEDRRSLVRRRAALMLTLMGERVRAVVPSLVDALEDGDPHVRAHAAAMLIEQGEVVAPHVPHLVEAMRSQRSDVRGSSAAVLHSTGLRLRRRGRLYWWVVPQVYRSELLLFGLLFVGWFGVIACAAPAGRVSFASVAVTTLVAAVPIVAGGAALAHAVTQPWAAGFLPGDGLVPFSVSLVLSHAFVCALAAVWARRRRVVTRPSEPGLRSALRRLFFTEKEVTPAYVPSRMLADLLWARRRVRNQLPRGSRGPDRRVAGARGSSPAPPRGLPR